MCTYLALTLFIKKTIYITLKITRREIYTLNTSMDPASMTKRSDSNPVKKSKLFTKYKHFLISDQLLYTYDRNVIAFMKIWNVASFLSYLLLALENGCKVKVIHFQEKVTIILNYLRQIKFNFLYKEKMEFF